MVRKRKQGHYRRICGEYKANETFRGKGHAHNICKSCMSNKKIDTAITTFEQEILCDDDDEHTDTILVEELFGSGYDPFNLEIDNLPPIYAEQKKYKKLNKEEKNSFEGIVDRTGIAILDRQSSNPFWRVFLTFEKTVV